MIKTDGIDPVECALLDLESWTTGERQIERWTAPEMAELKKHCATLIFGESLHRAMVALFNNWTHLGGRADINEIEQWQREYENPENLGERAAA